MFVRTNLVSGHDSACHILIDGDFTLSVHTCIEKVLAVLSDSFIIHNPCNFVHMKIKAHICADASGGNSSLCTCKQFLYFGIINSNVSNDGWFLMSFVLAAMVAIMRPYKKTIHNFINCLLFVYMFLILWVSVINFALMNIYLEIAVSSVLYVPFLVLCLYFTYKLCKLCIKHVQNRRKIIVNQSKDDSDAATSAEQAPILVPATNVAMDDCEYVADDLFPDRVLNPGGYNEQHAHYQPLENSTL